MTVEIIALVEKNYGQKVLEEMKSSPGVLQILNAAGRSSDLFEDKQFGMRYHLSIFCRILKSKAMKAVSYTHLTLPTKRIV